MGVQGALKQLIPTSLQSGNPEDGIKVLAGLISPEVSVLSLQMPSVPMSSHGHPSEHICFLICSNMDNSHIGLGPTPGGLILT